MVSIIRSIAPGIPRIPMIRAFIILSPIWKLKALPIKLIININIPPNIEFPISFIIHFRGTEKILPIKNKKNIQAKYVIIVFVSNSNHLKPFYSKYMIKAGQILL